jgi:hypothetical protein
MIGRAHARRRGVASALVLSTLIVLSASEASAQSVLTDDAHIESPQRFAFELRFGPYSPEIDDGLPQGTTACGSGPYAAVFDNDTALMTEVEFDWQALNIFIGTLGLGGSMGVFHVKAMAFNEGECTRSEDETGLWLLPLTAMVVLRFDIFATLWSIPLVPYFKVGLSYNIWIATDAEGTATAADGSRGYGGSFGLRLAGGVMLQLDWLEPRSARTFDNEYGVNHSYLFFEWYRSWADSFGSGDRMNVGDNTWVAGLALEF